MAGSFQSSLTIAGYALSVLLNCLASSLLPANIESINSSTSLTCFLVDNIFKDRVQTVDVLVSRWLLNIANPDDFDEGAYFTPLEDAVKFVPQLYWLFKVDRKKLKLVKQLLCEEVTEILFYTGLFFLLPKCNLIE